MQSPMQISPLELGKEMSDTRPAGPLCCATMKGALEKGEVLLFVSVEY